MHKSTPGTLLIEMDEVDSTNRFAFDLIQQGGQSHGVAIRAQFQTSGRGQRGAMWESEPGKNLLISYILHPTNLSTDDHFLLNQSLCIAVWAVLKELVPQQVTIKWPNDIMAGDCKIAGLLIENSIRANFIQHTVAGIGVNVNQLHFSIYSPPATSLRLIGGNEFDTGECLRLLTESVQIWFGYLSSGKRKIISETYESALFRKGIPSGYETGDREFTGTLLGVRASGELMIETEAGEELIFGNKGVKFLFK